MKEISQILKTVSNVLSDYELCEELISSYKTAHPIHLDAIDKSFGQLCRPVGVTGVWAYRKFVIEQLNRVVSNADLSEPTNIEVVCAICKASEIAPIHGVQMLTALYLCAQYILDESDPFEFDIKRRLKEDASVGQMAEAERIVSDVKKRLKAREGLSETNSPLQGQLF